MALYRCGIEVERRDHQAYEAAWRKLTPTGTVPVLVLGDLVMTDSSVMLEYLHERYGGLWPASPASAARARSIALMADRTLGAAVKDLVFHCRGRSPEAWDPAVIGSARQQWLEAMPGLEQALGGAEFYVEGAGITDYVLASRFGLGMAYGMPDPESAIMNRWFQRISEQAVFRTTAPPSVISAIDRGWHT
jgi:glutathione S-transferase